MDKTDKDEEAALAFQKMFGTFDEFVAGFKEVEERIAKTQKELDERMRDDAKRMPGTLRLPV